ncbi:hypothetical protein [Bradyrhizobium sp. SYSU BS000235]|uniref:hypothetical protein n=1 Tax=Bradyrhizobium sp. SYSU BS000235 TaxID=3411332 RepID=UPI003C74F5DB
MIVRPSRVLRRRPARTKMARWDESVLCGAPMVSAITPGGNTDRLVLDQQPEDRETRRLRKRGQSGNRMGLGHLTLDWPGTGVAGYGKHRFPHSLVSARIVQLRHL